MTNPVTHECISCQETFPKTSLLKAPSLRDHSICLCPACGEFIANAAAVNQRENGHQAMIDLLTGKNAPTVDYPFAANVPLVCYFCQKSSENVELLLTARLLYELDCGGERISKLFTLGPDLNELCESMHPKLIAAIHVCNECAAEAVSLASKQDGS